MSPEFPYLDESSFFRFPAVETATEDGILAVGGNLSPGMLLSAYRQGVFPWYSEKDPILWWSPDPRFVLFPSELHLSKSTQRTLRRKTFRITFDTAFTEVIDGCRSAPRPGQNGTWITGEIVEGYTKLHELGYAHSVESWRGSELAGGLYGVALGSVFFGESMFSRAADASKAALAELIRVLLPGGLSLVDCQSYTPHLARLGAREIPREEFLGLLDEGLRSSTRQGNWSDLSVAAP